MGIDISAAPPEFRFGRASISNDPNAAEVSGSHCSFGARSGISKVLICGTSHERQYMAILNGSSDGKREDVGSISSIRIK
jgi:hypothetical protein